MSENRKEKCKKEVQKTEKEIKRLNNRISDFIKKVEQKRMRTCLLIDTQIMPPLVDEMFNILRTANLSSGLDVIVDSPGGDIDAAYNLASLFQKYGSNGLTFIIPRWAKSAATLLACGGDVILMTDVAELGPLDPQITQVSLLEDRVEQFSPLHVQTTMEMIRNEYEKGSKDLAEGLLKRLQFPLTLGSFIKAHEISEQYLVRLLKERMEKTGKLGASPEKIANCLTRQYADHGFCINITEAKKIGLNVEEIEGELLNLIWSLYGLIKKREEVKNKIRKESRIKDLEKLPREILEKILKTM